MLAVLRKLWWWSSIARISAMRFRVARQSSQFLSSASDACSTCCRYRTVLLYIVVATSRASDHVLFGGCIGSTKGADNNKLIPGLHWTWHPIKRQIPQLTRYRWCEFNNISESIDRSMCFSPRSPLAAESSSVIERPNYLSIKIFLLIKIKSYFVHNFRQAGLRDQMQWRGNHNHFPQRTRQILHTYSPSQ